ncbi:hypothetical protein GCM10011450_21990 [Advenella faeciporci]|uniref:Uncharacterized protein n=1 Tax=Advenella faeciporci TaxID=797535 RepID=A0A918JP34_9BURK|nr:hypothetical protein [Advenella faeciporci]NLY34995.1 hypothetical protein [Alcaligenaceae bacterium]GGW91379.1 hypothetical protein GCM10011450_21990 [Advenella faeciporci]
MTFIPKENIIKYFNFKINIPEGYKYLAIDKDGTLYAYLNKPTWNKATTSWVPNLLTNQLMEFLEIGIFESNQIPPEDSLVKIA